MPADALSGGGGGGDYGGGGSCGSGGGVGSGAGVGAGAGAVSEPEQQAAGGSGLPEFEMLTPMLVMPFAAFVEQGRICKSVVTPLRLEPTASNAAASRTNGQQRRCVSNQRPAR